MLFQSKHPQYEHLRKKWIGRHKAASAKLWERHGNSLRHLTLGSLGGLMLLSTPGMPLATPQGQVLADNSGITRGEDKNALLAMAIKGYVPQEMRKLTPEEENNISGILSEKLNMSVKPELEGIRLNRSYGVIGGEQHLYRYPGDNIFQHADTSADWAMYGSAGIAPGLGAWGYFAPSEASFTQEDKEREKYYLAVQTFLAPGFSENVVRYRDFFKYRKMLVVNPQTGQSIVAVVADAGPAEWTGKHLGGSPEVMQGLGLAGGPRKGPVLYFFIDDPENKIPLGPISMGGN